MVDFTKRNGLYESFGREDEQQLNIQCKRIHESRKYLDHDRLQLGWLLTLMWQGKFYRVYGNGDCSQKTFFLYCSREFDLDKSAVSRLMNVFSEFGDMTDGKAAYKKQWEKYSWALLSEMLSLTEEERKQVKSNWTRQQLREFKKSLREPETEDDVSDIYQPVLDSVEEVPAEDEPEEFHDLNRRDLVFQCIAYQKLIDDLKEGFLKEVQDYQNMLSQQRDIIDNMKGKSIDQNSWVAVKDEVPIEDEMKLVYCVTKVGSGSVNRAWFDGKAWHGTGSMAGVTHWMDLPDPPEECKVIPEGYIEEELDFDNSFCNEPQDRVPSDVEFSRYPLVPDESRVGA